MDTQLVRTTRLSDLHALGFGGQPVIMAFDQIARYLKRTLSADHARLFCEPSIDARAGTIDWYGPAGAPPRQVDGLDPEARTQIHAVIGSRIADIRDHAEALKRSGGENDRLMADMLLLAIEIPGTDHICAIGDDPVLVGWGHVQQGPGAPRGVLMRLVPSRARSKPVPSPVVLASAPLAVAVAETVVRKRPSLAWLWWLLATLLLLLLLLWLLYWQQPRLVALLNLPSPAPSCQVSVGELDALALLSREQARGNVLLQQLADLRGSLATKRTQCPPPQTGALSAPTTDQERVKEAGGHTGRLQVSLAWDDENDLDLSIVCPGGERLSYRTRTGCGGGTLDVDANGANPSTPPTKTPVENIVWQDNPPSGRYQVFVDFYSRRVADRSPFRLTVNIPGQPEKRIDDAIGEGEHSKAMYEFTIP
jgi:hypothetical protein